jgi:site-specific DNA recombinase
MNTKKLVGYCRVSTDNQKEEGTIEIQENGLMEYAEQNGYELVTIFKDEGVSGGLENRPGLVELFNYLEADNQTEGVLIYKLDRLARDLYIQEHLIKKLEMLHRSILSVKEPNLDSSDPMRKAFRQFMGIVAELEKAFITMRLSGGRINKARKGGYAGGRVPLGYIAENNDLKIDGVAIKLVKEIFYLRRYKKLGYRKIARFMNNKNAPTVRGGKWHPATVKYILNNNLYRGRIAYKNVEFKRQDLRAL